MMAWSALPRELEELILTNLSLLELARASRTCLTFAAFSRTQLVKAQDARLNLAVECFGHERIVALARVIDNLLKGAEPAVKPSMCSTLSVSHDGVLHVERWMGFGHELLDEPGDMRMMVSRSYKLSLVTIFISLSRGSSLGFLFGGIEENPTITVRPCAESNVEEVALLQALLCLGLAASLSSAWPRFVDIVPRGLYGPYGYRDRSAHVALQNQIAPLLPLIAQHPKLRVQAEE
jgi:hypothetical protein